MSKDEGHENSPDQHEPAPLPSRTDEKRQEVTESGNERIASPAAWTTAGMTGASMMSTAGVVGGTTGMLVATAVGGGATAAGMVVRRVAPRMSERMGLRKPDRDKDKTKGRDGNRRQGGLSAMGSVGHGGRRRRGGLLGRRGSGEEGGRRRRAGLLPGRRGAGQGRGLLGGRRARNRDAATGSGRRRRSGMAGLLGGLAGRRRRGRTGSDQHGRRRRGGLLGGFGRRDDRRRGRRNRHGSGGHGHGSGRKNNGGGLLGRLFNGIRKNRKNNGNGNGGSGGKGDKVGKKKRRPRIRIPGWLKPDGDRRRKKPEPASGWTTVAGGPSGKTRWDRVDQGKPPSRTSSAGGNPSPTARDIARVANSSGGMMPNPFESHIESVQATAGSFHVNRAKDLIDWVNHAPEAAAAEAAAWRSHAHKIQEEIPVNPAFAEALQTYANAQQGLVTQIYEHASAFRSQHATELAHLEDERPNSSKWDRSLNQD